MEKKTQSLKSTSNSKDENEQNKPILFPQVQCAVTASIGQFICGSINGWSGSALTKMESDFSMRSTEYSLVASTITYGALAGGLISGKLMDSLGRKRLMSMIGPLAACGWAMIGLATNIYMVYLGRFVCGCATGLIYNCSNIYISETCEARLRGRFTIMSSSVYALGILFSVILSGFYDWRTSAYLFIIPNAIFFWTLCFVPETPYWHLLKDDNNAAFESLSRLRGPNSNMETEMKIMIQKMSNVDNKTVYKELLNKRTLLPLAISLFVQTIQQVSGVNVVISYTTKIVKSTSTSHDIYMIPIYVALSQILGTLVSPFIVDRHGRRTLLIISGALLGILSTLLGGYFYSLNGPTSWPSWTPLVILISVGFSYAFGLRPVTWLYRSEIFNTSARSVGSSIAFLHNRLLQLLILQIYPYAEDAFGNSSIFFTFGILSLLGVVGTILFVPETKGKTLEEIQEYFENRVSKKKQNNTYC